MHKKIIFNILKIIIFVFTFDMFLRYIIGESNCSPVEEFSDIIEDEINEEQSKVAVLLTSAINPKRLITEDKLKEEIEFRTNLYDEVIQEYLNKTNLNLYIIESTGTKTLQEKYKNEPRIKYYCINIKNSKLFGIDNNSTTGLESYSLIKAINHFKLKKYENIIKITGRYYIPNIESLIENIDNSCDMYVQQRHSPQGKWQSSEIFGMKSEIFPYIMLKCLKSNLIMEKFLFNLYFQNDENKNPIFKVQRFKSIKLNKPTIRGGDGKYQISL